MSVTFTVPEGFEYVGVSLLSTVFVLAGQSSLVSKWRKRAGIRYPQMYAEKAEAEASKDAFTFNCAQRAHQNTLEKIPVVYVTTIITGLKYPIVAALGCGAWSLSRIFYTRGYLTQPEKRHNPLSIIGMISPMGLLLVSTGVLGHAVISKLLL